jgi:aspartyl/glutamyl-tRNA(Asn/Gln) amidotransferase C subunit
MTKVLRAEVVSIARISHIAVQADELDPMTTQLEEVLTYAARVREMVGLAEVPSRKNVNVYRADTPRSCDPEPLRSRAPEREGDYFVVPIILDSSGQQPSGEVA